MSKLRVGIIGFAQMHVTTMIQSFLALPERFAFIGCADTPSRLRRSARKPERDWAPETPY